jgi:hypothetical protein
VYEAPGGTSRIRAYQDRPLAPISQLLAGWSIEQTTPLVTAEGEYGALCSGTRAGTPCVAGFVFGDLHAVVLEGSVEHALTLRDLVLAWRLDLGVRVRRFLYAPPPGWTPMPNHLATTWFPPRFPDDAAQLVVYPATPTTRDAHEELSALLDAERHAVVGEIREVSLATASGLTGRQWTFSLRSTSGAILHRELACLRHAPYRYALKFESTGARDDRTFLAVADSIRPLPSPGQEWLGLRPGTHLASEHWSD